MPPTTSVDAAAAATTVPAEDEVPQCPLCLEDLDATDLSVRACQCGYPVCLLCLHHIRQQLNGKCPACRTPYSEENFVVIDKVDPEAAARELRERAEAKKAREKRDRAAAAERERAAAAAASQAKAKTTFKHVRVVQRNLVYVIGLSLSLAREEALKRTQMFGRFGRINRVLVNRGHPYNADAPGGPSIAAYILFARDTDASTAARVMNGEVFDGRELRCAIATTKYCDAFIRHGSGKHLCGNDDCPYLHELAPYPEDVLTREEVLSRQLGPPPPAHLFTFTPTLPTPTAASSIRLPTTLAPRRVPPPASSSALPAASPPLTASRPPTSSSPTAPTSFAGVASSAAPSPTTPSSHESWLLKLPPPRATGGGWGAAADVTDPSTPAQLRSRTPSPADAVSSGLLSSSGAAAATPLNLTATSSAPSVSVSLPPLTTSTRRSRASPKVAAAPPPPARVTLPPPPARVTLPPPPGFEEVAAAPASSKPPVSAAAAPPPPGFGNFPSLSQARAASAASAKPLTGRSLSSSSSSSNSGSRENMDKNTSSTAAATPAAPTSTAPTMSAPPGFVAPALSARPRLPPPSVVGAPGFAAPGSGSAAASPPSAFQSSPMATAKAESPRPTFAAPRTSPSVLSAPNSSSWSMSQEPSRAVGDGLARPAGASNVHVTTSSSSSPTFAPAPARSSDAPMPSADTVSQSEPASSPLLSGVLFADATSSGPSFASTPDLSVLLAQLGGGPNVGRGAGSGSVPSSSAGPPPAGFAAAFPSSFGSGAPAPLPSPPRTLRDPRSGHGASPGSQPNAGPPGISRVGVANPLSAEAPFGQFDGGRGAYAQPMPAANAFASSLPPLPPPSEGSFAMSGTRTSSSARSRSRFGFARGGRTSPGPLSATSAVIPVSASGRADGGDGLGGLGGGGGSMGGLPPNGGVPNGGVSSGGVPLVGEPFAQMFSSLELEPPAPPAAGLDYPPGIPRPPGMNPVQSSPPSSSYASPPYGIGGVLGQGHPGAPYSSAPYPSQVYPAAAYASPYGNSAGHPGGPPPGMSAATPPHGPLTQPRRPSASSSPARSSRFAFAGAGAGPLPAGGPPPGMGYPSSSGMYLPPGSDGGGMAGGAGPPRGGLGGDAGATAAPPGFGPAPTAAAQPPPPPQADTNFTEMSTQDKLAAIFSSARGPRQSSTPALRIN